MEIKPIAHFRSPFEGKFGIPRQSSIVSEVRGRIVFEKEYASADALRGLEGFDYLWIIWGFHLNHSSRPDKLTVRPPRLGGNTRLGVFATRSPFRPNPLGLSCVHIESIEEGSIVVSGADLADSTPIFDIKPYLPYSDSFPQARCGFVQQNDWEELQVTTADDALMEKLRSFFDEEQLQGLFKSLSQDPRPSYERGKEKNYGLTYSGHNITFHIEGKTLVIDSAI